MPSTTTAAAAPAPQEWLQEFASTQEAHRLAELEADRELLDRMMWAGYQGRDWEKVAGRLVGYGLRVLEAWILSGQIIEKCKEKQFRLAPCHFTREEAADLARDTVTVALVKFRDQVLIPKRWDPSRGASLKTYFIGQCLLRYPNEHRRGLAQQQRERLHAQRRHPGAAPEDSDWWEHVASRGEASTERRALGRLAALEELSRLDRRTRLVVIYRSEGYSWEEVAELTGLSVAAAKSRLHRLQSHQET